MKLLKNRSKEYQRGYKAGYAKAIKNVDNQGRRNQERILVVQGAPNHMSQEDRDAHVLNDTRIGFGGRFGR